MLQVSYLEAQLGAKNVLTSKNSYAFFALNFGKDNSLLFCISAITV